MTGPTDRRADIQDFLNEAAESGGFKVIFTNADDFGARTGEVNLFYIIEKSHPTVGDKRTHLKGLVPKVNVPFILSLIAGDSIEQIAREAKYV